MSQYNSKSSWHTYPASQVQSTINLQSQLLTDQRLSYICGDSATGVYLKYHE